MKKKGSIFTIIFLLCLCFSVNSFPRGSDFHYATTNDDSTAITTKSGKLPRFDFHLGAGVVSGGRVGLRILFLKNYSVEFSYGNGLENFVSASNVNRRYGFGINWHKNNSNFVFSLLGVVSHDVYLGTKNSYFISPTIGLITFKSEGLHTFIRGGIAIQFNNNTSSGSYSTTFWPNLDAGITFVIY